MMTKSNFILIISFYVGLTSTLQAQSVVTKENLINASITPAGKLVVSPSKTSSQNDFDFFEGNWKLRNRRLKTRLDKCTEWFEYDGTNTDKKMLNGLGHTNNNLAVIDGKPLEGVGLTLFNPETRLWSIYWASSRNGKLDHENPVVGSFEGNIGSFYCLETMNGKPIVVMARWDKTDPNHAVWSQAFSDDNGKTWEWNSYNYGSKIIEDEKEQLKKLLTFDTSIPIPDLHFDNAGALKIEASTNSSHDDFDGLAGKWKMYHKRLKSRLTNSNEWIDLESIDVNYGAILNGIGNTDLYKATFDGKPFEGFTIRLFNPETKLWSLYWVASNSGVLDPPVVGSFDNDIGHFFCKDIYKGKDVIVLFRWDMRDREHPVWSQAFSPDNGKTWEWNWINVSYRID
ncbi:hypothetical protein [Chryseolinea lacunae]|uniref:DUF4185 domain-containing protein n=1 Tax=Chryseolinea lacunae TaxID=2801331 RepID=A0ABS1KZK5_9BACT|nr:hypothetical protein [Chryseolinea lacunae]MBL0744672.1 hypothetical protein [Chryseolinea lacunae]